MVKIAVLASFTMDLVMRVERRPDAGETVQGDFAMHLGGKGFNQAVAARRLGADVAVTGRVGDDDFGRMFLAALDDEGIDRRAVVIDPAAGTGVATIYVEPNGENTIVQSPRANRNVSPEDIERGYPLLGRPQIAIFNNETSMRGAMDFAMRTRSLGQRGMSTEFVEGGALAMFNAAPAMFAWDDIVHLSDLLVVNDREAELLLGEDQAGETTTTQRVSDLCWSRATQSAVITSGASGSTGGDRSGSHHSPAFVVPVVDTTGAGDAFCAALAVRLAEGAPLPDAMRFANAAGALACTKHGAYPSMPYRADVEALIAAQGSSP